MKIYRVVTINYFSLKKMLEEKNNSFIIKCLFAITLFYFKLTALDYVKL